MFSAAIEDDQQRGGIQSREHVKGASVVSGTARNVRHP